MTATNIFYGYIFRRYDCQTDMMDFAVIQIIRSSSLKEACHGENTKEKTGESKKSF